MHLSKQLAAYKADPKHHALAAQGDLESMRQVIAEHHVHDLANSLKEAIKLAIDLNGIGTFTSCIAAYLSANSVLEQEDISRIFLSTLIQLSVKRFSEDLSEKEVEEMYAMYTQNEWREAA